MSEIDNEDNDIGFYTVMILFVIGIFIIICFYLFLNNQLVKKVSIILMVILLIGICSYVLLNDKEATTIEQHNQSIQDPLENTITISYNNSQYTYSFQQLISTFSSISGLGSRINQFGLITGPDMYVGIPVKEILNSVENLPKNYYMLAKANDYTYNFSKENISGFVPVYYRENDSFVNNQVTMILAYQENDQLIKEENGGPLRIAFITDNGVITKSDQWIKSVNTLLIMKLQNNSADQNKPPVINATSSKNAGIAPLSIHFHAEVFDPDGIITFYEWN